ncbi:MAG TPA: ABC transporter ATP-binding protein [Nitrososphaerales archaeon]|nr:ABC transporter ATP-binding protein [Nitrososphaerales archaeon]
MIVFEDVSFVHSTGVRALDHVNLSVGGKETVAVVGENGAGKTTLVKQVTGLLKPTSGRVTVDGEATTKKTTAELSRKVGVAFQNPDHQLFSESVEEEVAFGLRNFGFDAEAIKRRTDWALDFFGLSRYRGSSPLTLSGGEKKRLTIACALSWDPEVVILDEPTVGQDAIQKERLSGIVSMLQSSGKTVIIVSHDIEFLWPLRPRTVVMSNGRILADGPSSKVLLDKEVLSKSRVTEPQLVRIYNGLGSRPSSPFADVPAARRWIEEETRR